MPTIERGENVKEAGQAVCPLKADHVFSLLYGLQRSDPDRGGFRRTVDKSAGLARIT